ncbi:MAG: peptidase M64 [Bacteroidaceae bacterium]|nr:peptidase M64 [Bacteroidaceae bacterium]
MKIKLLFAALLLPICTFAKVDFDQWFTDSTLRLDYIFAGSNTAQEISLSEMACIEGWAGRRVNMDTLLLAGNGQVTLTDPETGKVLYKHAFSTLFQEWQHTEQAVSVRRAFENTVLVPMPKHPVDVTLTLVDNHRIVTAKMTHRVDPADNLIRKGHVRLTKDVRQIFRNGAPSEKIDLVFVAEGYTKAQMGQFYKDVEIARQALFSHAPFDQYEDRFNAIAVAVPSEKTDVSVPQQGQWHDTPCKSHFNTFYSERYLMTERVFQLHDLLEGLPYEHIIILANTPTYGGGGIFNMYMLTSSRHREFRPVVVHEFGHSFAGLADEYFYDDMYETYYPADTEPWEPNLTTLHDFSAKWQHMVKDTSKRNTGEVGIYEGGGYQSRGVYRGSYDCRMKTNSYPVFCPVCQDAIKRVIEYNTVEQTQ